MRRGINQHTLEKICRREPVRVVKLAKCLNALEEYDSGNFSFLLLCLINAAYGTNGVMVLELSGYATIRGF